MGIPVRRKVKVWKEKSLEMAQSGKDDDMQLCIKIANELIYEQPSLDDVTIAIKLSKTERDILNRYENPAIYQN